MTIVLRNQKRPPILYHDNRFVKMVFLVLLVSLLSIASSQEDKRRPFYNYGHMVISIDEIDQFLKSGSNALEADVSYNADSTVFGIYHGTPCDCGRYCEYKTDVAEYLQHLQAITNPATNGSYYEQMTMLMFDNMIKNVSDKVTAGKNLADIVIQNLWVNDGRQQQMKIVLSVHSVDDADLLVGFVQELIATGNSDAVNNVGFNVDVGDLTDVYENLSSRGLKDNFFISDGTTNCFEFVYPYDRLDAAVANRDNGGFVDKVFRFAVDGTWQMEKAIGKGVDGIFTNLPDTLRIVLETENIATKVRLATINDDPFSRFSS